MSFVSEYERSVTALSDYILECSVKVGLSSYHTSGWGVGIAQLVVLGLAATVSRVRYSSGDIFL